MYIGRHLTNGRRNIYCTYHTYYLVVGNLVVSGGYVRFFFMIDILFQLRVLRRYLESLTELFVEYRHPSTNS